MKHKYRKDKGVRGLEKPLTADLQEAGFAAEHIRDQPGRRKSEGEGGDVSIPLLGEDLTIECKFHNDGFSKVYAALENASIACIKMGRKKPLVIVPLDLWIRHIRLAESYRAPKLDAAE